MEGEMDAQVIAWGLAFGCVDSMAAKAVCRLGIPAMLAASPEGLTALQIAHTLGQDAPRQAQQLDRLMRLLCARGVFAVHVGSASADSPRYTLTAVSRWLGGAGDTDSVYPFLQMLTSAPLVAAWEHLPGFILQGGAGGNPFERAHDNMSLWSFACAHADFSEMFNAGMACSTRASVKALLYFYHGFADTRVLVDVGGGVGTCVSAIVQRYPHINGINFDLPHLTTMAPIIQGVQHIGGDMFESIPPCDTIFMKWILHDWDDEHCIKILQNCYKALSKGGKLIIMDALLDHSNSTKHPYDIQRMEFDILMMVYTKGKERTRSQFGSILQGSGFLKWRIIDIPCFECILEAFPCDA